MHFTNSTISPLSDKQGRNIHQTQLSISGNRQNGNVLGKLFNKFPICQRGQCCWLMCRIVVHSDKDFQYAFQLSEEMVDVWLERERPYIKDTKALRHFSERLAVDLYINRKKRQAERMPLTDILPLAAEVEHKS